jgi:hypothetical protein
MEENEVIKATVHQVFDRLWDHVSVEEVDEEEIFPTEAPVVAEPETQESRSPEGNLDRAYYFRPQNFPIDITQPFPEYEVVRTFTLPAGNFVVNAGLELILGVVRSETSGEPVNSPSAICVLKGPVTTRTPDMDKVTVALAGYPLYGTLEVSLRGAFTLEQPGEISLECTSMNPGAQVRARALALTAVEVAEVMYDWS